MSEALPPASSSALLLYLDVSGDVLLAVFDPERLAFELRCEPGLSPLSRWSLKLYFWTLMVFVN